MTPLISTKTHESKAPFARRLISRLLVASSWGDKDKDVVSRSPLPHLLKSNTPPSDSEISIIRTAITDAEVRIEELCCRIPSRNHAHASQTKDKLLKFIERHKAVLSPVRHIPSEVLKKIFLCYADDRVRPLVPGSNNPMAIMPWCLGHISHRWRNIALNFPSLWDNMPLIDMERISSAKPNLRRLYVRAWTCLIQRSGASPTLKLDIKSCLSLKGTKHPIIDEMIYHSERIVQLHIDIDQTNMHQLRVLKGRVPNLQILHLDLRYILTAIGLDMFETAPALRQVTLGGGTYDRLQVLLPWSQITYFDERLRNGLIGPPSLPLSSLCSLTHLRVERRVVYYDSRAFFSSYQPTTLPNLLTLRVLDYCGEYNQQLEFFLESLTIPIVEVVKVRCAGLVLAPCLLSMFSRSHEPSQLRKLAFRTSPLEPGELSALLRLTPQLIELDINVPPMHDLLRLTYCEREVMLVPMLQNLYLHSSVPVKTSDQFQHYHGLAQSRCELDRRDSLGHGVMPSLAIRANLNIFRLVFDSTENRDISQKVLNDWLIILDVEETKALDILNHLGRDIQVCHWNTDPPVLLEHKSIANGREYILNTLDQNLARIEQCVDSKAITHKVLRETNAHFYLRNYITDGSLPRIPEEDKYHLESRILNILAEWDQLFLNNLDDYCWARTSPELCDQSLVYISKDKHQALHTSPDALTMVYGLKFDGPFDMEIWGGPLVF